VTAAVVEPAPAAGELVVPVTVKAGVTQEVVLRIVLKLES
jgi:hypothetical protein